MENEPHISVIDPINPAIDRVKDLLFYPIDLRRWFIIGFCAFLANLIKFDSPLLRSFGWNIGPSPRRAEASEIITEAQRYINSNLYWLLPAFIIAVVFAIVLFILLLWLSSRGKFMLLYCVAENTAEVKVPWHKYKKQGNSLFRFRLVFLLITGVCSFVLALPIFLASIALWQENISAAAGAMAIVFFGLLTIAAILVFAVIAKLTKDFVVPVMYLRGCGAVEGWRIFMPLLKANAGSFACYLLFYILILFAIFMAKGGLLFVACILTCCISNCILAIPYIGTVLLLPIPIFTCAYPLYFLSQFGPDWDVFNVPTVVPLSAI